ncbi:MAG TPA: hypothetical protein VJ183_08935 [Chloroflexia bacterium]|nr:hypothetical protein [Chloroflexia bacterium]
MATETQAAFKGTEAQQELAARTFEVMKRKGMLFGANAPIRMSLQSIADALTKPGGPLAGTDASTLIPDLRASLLQNEEVFAREANDEFVTTKAGRAFHSGGGPNIHTFKERLNIGATSLDVEKAKEYEASIVDLAASRAEKSAMLEEEEEEEAPPPPIRIQLPTSPFPRNLENSTIIPAHLIPEPLRPPVPEPPQEVEVEAPPAPQRVQEPAATTTPAAQPQPQVAQAPQAPTATPPSRRAEEEQGAKRPAATTAPPVPTVPTIPAAPVPQPRVAPTPPVQQPTSAPAEAPATAPAEVAPTTTTTPTVPVTAAPPTTAVSPPPATAPSPTPATQPDRPAVEAQAPVVAPRRPQVATPPPAPVAPVITGPIEVTVLTADGPVTVDLRDEVDEILIDDAVAEALERMIESTVAADARMVHFGSEMFPEESVQRFSKGDFRRIKEYLDEPETGGLASDRDIMADVLNRRVDFPDYERLRFSVNYRMLKEKKDFEFVGIDSDRLWISAGASPVPPPARKPAEIGQDYRFLEDPATKAAEDEEAGDDQGRDPLSYSLTYYEYENGVLPYDLRFKRVFPGAVFDDQRSSLIRFEIPQLYAAIVGELRYPSGNRGGFIMGLRDLFVEHMVPGAKFALVPTDRGEDIFEVHFNRADEQEVSLLQFDDRKSRYVFRPVSFAIETDPAMLPTQEKLGKLHNQKKLEEAERRRLDVVIANAFEMVGEQNDGKLWAAFDELYAVVNIERPVSRAWLRTLLSGTYPAFYADETTEDAYFYDAALKS